MVSTQGKGISCCWGWTPAPLALLRMCGDEVCQEQYLKVEKRGVMSFAGCLVDLGAIKESHSGKAHADKPMSHCEPAII